MKILNSSVALATLAMAAGVALIGTAHAADMPPIPDSIKEKGVLHVGVKCDYPPDGFLDASGKPVGLEVSLAKQISEYAFGDAAKSELMCVTSANRVPALVGGKVDMLTRNDEVAGQEPPYEDRHRQQARLERMGRRIGSGRISAG